MTSKRTTNTLFVLVLAGALTASSMLVKPKDYEAYNLLSVSRTVEQIRVEPDDTVDALMIGDSLVYTSICPMDLWVEHGITSFNAATSSQHLCDGYAIMTETFKTQKPKLVILDMFCAYKDAGVYKEESAGLTVLGRMLPVLHYHSLYKLLPSPKELIRKTDPKRTPGYIQKGFTGKPTVAAYTGPEDYMGLHTEPDPFSEESGEYIEKIASFCKANGAELLLISSPSPENWNEGRSVACAAFAKEHDLTFIDMNQMNEELQMDWAEDTCDGGDHLNVYGATKVTAYLGDYIKEHYDLPDHRGDEAYSEWTRIADMIAANAAKEGK